MQSLKFRSRNESIFIAGKLLQNERDGKCIYIVFIAKYQTRNLILVDWKAWFDLFFYFFWNLLSDFLKQTRLFYTNWRARKGSVPSVITSWKVILLCYYYHAAASRRQVHKNSVRPYATMLTPLSIVERYLDSTFLEISHLKFRY